MVYTEIHFAFPSSSAKKINKIKVHTEIDNDYTYALSISCLKAKPFLACLLTADETEYDVV